MLFTKYQTINVNLLILLLINTLFFQITTINVIGLGVLLVIAFVNVFSARKVPIDEAIPAAKTADVNDKLLAALSEINQAIDFEVTVFENEINRTNQIIKEAMPAISNAFKELESLSNQQPNMNNALNKQIQAAVSDGIRSLQFEDFTFQILDSLKSNIHSLTEISAEIVTFQHAVQRDELSAVINLKEKCQAISVKSKLRNDVRHVNQTSMEEGEIELF
ncbi:MAG: hypothetical protein ACSHW0_12350 [Thalassotalea sp.]